MTRGPKTKNVVARISDKLSIHTDLTPYIGHDENVPMWLRDAHWIWEGSMPAPRPVMRRSRVKKKPRVVDNHVLPARVRDSDGALKSVASILHREIFGVEYAYRLGRGHAGCDYRCVNPFHLGYPKDNGPSNVVPASLVDEDHQQIITALSGDLSDYIGEHGRDLDKIYTHFGLDYSEKEIQDALELVQ